MFRSFIAVGNTYHPFIFDDFSTSELSEVSKNQGVNKIVNGGNNCVSGGHRMYDVVYKVEEKRGDDAFRDEGSGLV